MEHRKLFLALSLLLATGCRPDEPSLPERQAEVAARGTQVMPFDLEQTTHIFTEADFGGVQEVVSDEPADTNQIALIREHLQEEAARFARGDFSDPAQIHGEDMPGLQAMKNGWDRMEIIYSDIPLGGRVEYRTADPQLVQAVHDWFAAQRSDHGRHAHSHQAH